MPRVSALQAEPFQERIVPVSPTALQRLVDEQSTSFSW